MNESHTNLPDTKIRLLDKQLKMRKFLYPFWLLCEICSWLLFSKKLSPRENTKRCYETLFDPLCAETGVWPDYTEGYYPQGNEDYDEAQIKQFDFILDKTNCSAKTKVLDTGCGNGKLLKRALERGCSGSGITISQEQFEQCRKEGLDVILCSFENIKKHYEPQQFDVVVLCGPTEHFLTEEDVLHGRAEGIRSDLFETLRYLLKPAGRVFIACIHFRQPTDITQAIQHPLHCKIGGYSFNTSVLTQIFSGWYPYGDDYERAGLKSGFKLLLERDATEDYLITSRHWDRRLKHFVKNNRSFMIKFLVSYFFKDPRYFFVSFLFWYYDVWSWQFRGADKAPMKHKWLMFELI